MKILFADDETSLQELMRLELPELGHSVAVCGDGRTAISVLEKDTFDCILVDLDMPGANGLEVIEFARKRFPEMDAVIMTGKGTLESAIEALHQGVYDYLKKPCKLADIQKVLRQIEEKRTLTKKLRVAENQLSRLNKGTLLIGQSPAMLNVQRMIDRVAPSDSTVLILGETGTGKELVAKAVHDRSRRAGMPFVAVNCGALPENLIESELFGHRKGSFTGADSHRTGLLEVANQGTLFLDEIGELPKAVQAKFLRFLESGEVRKIGENTPAICDIRVICATHRNLENMSQIGDFREDLLFRINTFEIRLPALRDRLEDFPELITYLAKRFHNGSSFANSVAFQNSLSFQSAVSKQKQSLFTQEAFEFLQNYTWPGNIRQLVNVIEHALILSDTIPIGVESLPQPILKAPKRQLACDNSVTIPFPSKEITKIDQGAVAELLAFETGFNTVLTKASLKDLESAAIQSALDRNEGNKAKAADELGISLKTLYNKINQTADGRKTG